MPAFLSDSSAFGGHQPRPIAVAAAAAAADDAVPPLHGEARGYADLARVLLQPGRPALVAIGGWSGTGKTTQARMLAPLLGRPPGAIVLRSDVVRKTLMCVSETTRLGPEGYAHEITGRVYAALAAVAERILKSGQAAIVDAVCARPAERAAFARAAANAGAPFTGIWLEAPLTVRAARVAARTGDASDANAALVRDQESFDPGPLDWMRVSAAGAATSTHAAIVQALA